MATIIPPTTRNNSNTPVAATEPYTPGLHGDLLVAQPASTGLRRRNVTSQGDQKSNDSAEEEEVDADEYATQNDLFGPISAALLVDPVRIRGEVTPGAFEREYITRWLDNRGTSPTTRNRATVADLVPAHDIQQKIRVMVRRYPNAQIVRDWLQDQPSWYTQTIQQLQQFGTPVVHAMTRAVEPIRRNMPSAAACSRCCANTAETGAGAIVGAGVGACMGCSCAIALSGEAEEGGTPMTDEEKTAMAAFLTPAGAVLGAAVGAVAGPEECLRCTGEACQAACEAQDSYGGKRKTRKRKTRKGKRKRCKTRKRKKTVKRKRKKKRKKTRRRKK